MKLSKPQKQIYNMETIMNGSVSCVCGCMLLDTVKTEAEINAARNIMYSMNDALRTRIVLNGSNVHQYFTEYKETFVPALHFNSREELNAYADAYAKIPFTSGGSLSEITPVILPSHSGVLIKMHHIICDGWTCALVANHIKLLLTGYTPSAYSYADYLVTEEEYLRSKRYIKDNEFFKSKINECSEPLFFSSKPDVSFNSRRKTFPIEETVILEDFSRKLNTSVFTIILAAISFYFSRINNNADSFFVGTTVLNRTGEKERNTMGMYVNTVPVLMTPDYTATIADNIAAVNAEILSVLRHQKFNYTDILEETGKGKLFDVVVSYQNAQIVNGETIIEWYSNGMQAENLQIHIEDHDADGTLKMHFDYRTDKFTEKDIENMHSHIFSLIFDAIEHPEKKISDLEMLSDEEKQKILCEFNDTEVEYDKNTCVYKLFEKQAKKNPDKKAVIFKDISFTYSQLYALAEDYAGKLVSLGINAGDTVAVHLERSHKLVILQLAVLKIGAVFLPVDKRYPEERICLACADCDVKLLITDEKLSIAAAMSICEFENVAAEKAETVINKGSCYIIYTSGSTGRPKGCLLNGRGLLNFCKNNNTLEALNMIDDCVFACVNAVSFDYFIAESLLPLTNGFSMVILDEEESTIQHKFISVAEKNSITVLMTTPTRLKIYFNGGSDTTTLRQLKCICTSGEPLTAELLSQMYEKAPDAKIFNPIGPSECSVWDMGGELNCESGIDIHIGKPIANAQIYITDKFMNPVPVGVTGEICIAGHGVGDGYINNPELTAEKFIDNPFGEGKLYKTGDLAYWREDGNIVFVGRNDFQVKVRGLRIELGEIENAVSSVEGITLSVAIVREDKQGRQYICVFYTGEELDSKEVKAHLSEKLPKYMIPNVFVYLDEMPLTLSGKINRKALPDAEFEGIETVIEYIAPETEKEIVLAQVIKTVLKTDNVNMLDNFFNLGGDSINAIYAVSEIDRYGYELYVADLLKGDTFADVAKAMKANADKYIYEQGEVSGLVPFSPVMKVYLDANKIISKGFVHTCIVSTDSDENAVRKVLDIIVSHHDILRSTFETDGLIIHPSDVQTYSFNSIEIADTDEAETYLKNTGIDSDYLMNVVFCKTAGENLVSITIHHFLVDLISWEILLNDFKLALEQIKNGSEVSLPAKTASFMIWNEELRKYAENITEETKEYWNNINIELDDAKMFTADTVNKSEEFTFVFDKATTKKILAEANNKYGTKTNEILLTALGLAAGSIVDGDVGIIVESHGRTELQNRISLGRTVGWFTSCYPVVIKNNNNISDELINTKEVLRRMPSDGIDYLLLGQSMHENTSIVYNFYKTGFADNGLRAFIGAESLFPDKINVNCYVDDEILKIYISVPECNHRENICEELGTEFVKQLEKMLEICTRSAETVKTRSDFTDDMLTQAELDELRKNEGANIDDILSLTPAQEGIYVQYFRNADTKTYHLHNLCRIGKNTDIELIEKSVELLAQRHEVLKTAFAVLQSTGAIKQVILANKKPDFKVIASDEKYSQSVLDSIIKNESDKTLDLQKDSLFRVTVIDFEDIRFVYIHTHHIILDGWCFPIIINDLQRYYGELSAGIGTEELLSKISKEKESQTSYAQYVKWIRSQDKKENAEYWQKLLADCSAAHIFGKEKKENLKNENIVTFRTSLSADLSQKIEQFAKRTKVSANTVFECAFSIALQKYSGSDDVVFDKIISGRNIPLNNISETLGLFINTVPVRIASNENTTVVDLLNVTLNQTIEADKNGILPLTEVYRGSSIESKSVDALFVFENYFTGDADEIENGPLGVRLVSFEEQTEFNLNVAIMKEQNGYTIRTSYANEMYSEIEIFEFVRGYISVLETTLDETKKIKDISVADAEKLASFNKTEHTHNIPSNTTLYTLFEKTARENTEKICIKTAEREMTFGELCCISENLDAEIRKITNSTKGVIAVIAERSPEMYSAIYGIMRGGNAYLPVDPNYPPERIEYILKNSNAVAVVCQGKFTHLVGNTPCIDMTEFIRNSEKTGNILPAAADENDTAYIIYTSGSTGNPKGAKVSHKSAVNRILWMHDKYPLCENDVILQKTPYTFDVSVWELFWWGIVGGCLVASKPDEHFLPEKILLEAQKNKVTHIHFVPSVFELFLNYLENHTNEIEKFNSVKYVFLSGEALSASLVNRFYKLYDYEKVTLHNLYGPTECAVDVTYYDCKPEDCDPVPIGKTIYNTQIHIIDKYINHVPVGVQGELCIAGMNVGQGYLNNEKLTDEKFINNPFGEGKLYKTGDLAYWREDGNIIFCGRKDSQIKLNGQRIEIGEIEAVISGVDGVDSVAVIVKKSFSKDMLVAFFTGENSNDEAVRAVCMCKLPKYMVPAVFIQLDRLPLNKNGKLDRRILNEYKFEAVKTVDKEPPVNETERYVCEVFGNVLSRNDIYRNSDFFDMGGTSLSMISVLSEDAFEGVAAADFIRNPTPAKLAKVLNDKNHVATEYLEALFVSEASKRSLILLPFAGGGAEAYSNFVSSMKQLNSDVSIYFIRYLHSVDECKKAASEIARFIANDEIYIYSHCVGSALALQIIGYLENSNVTVNRYFAGASIPPARALRKNIWNIVPDKLLKSVLVKAGANIKKMPEKKLRDLFTSFRKDTDFANICLAEMQEKIKSEVSVIISKKDIFTKNYQKAEMLWRRYSDNVSSVSYIDSTSHYFQAENSDELAAIIHSMLD